jgi:hypothetical protein
VGYLPRCHNRKAKITYLTSRCILTLRRNDRSIYGRSSSNQPPLSSLFLVPMPPMRAAIVLSFLVIPFVSCFDDLHGTSPLDSSLGFTPLLNPLKSRHAGSHNHAHRRASRSLQARATSLPFGWTSKGCFSDRHVVWCPFIFTLIFLVAFRGEPLQAT